MKKILKSLSIIVAVAAIVVGGTVAYFSDMETSSNNVISAGTLDLQLECPEVITTTMQALHPESGTDSTGLGIDNLNGGELAALGSSDDARYTSNYGWFTSFSNVMGETWPVGYLLNENLNFGIPNIPADATLTTATATMEWQRGTGVNAARVRIYDGSTWQTQTLSLPSANTDTTTVIDLAALGFDTKAELDALQIQFQATQSGGYNPADNASKTSIDLIEVDATYTTTTGPFWCDNGLTGSFSVTNVKPGDTGNATIKYKNSGTIDGANLVVKASNVVNNENTCVEPELPGDVTCDNADITHGEMGANLAWTIGATTYTLAQLEAGVNLGAVAAGAEGSTTIAWSLPTTTGNDVQSDGILFNLDFTLTQN